MGCPSWCFQNSVIAGTLTWVCWVRAHYLYHWDTTASSNADINKKYKNFWHDKHKIRIIITVGEPRQCWFYNLAMTTGWTALHELMILPGTDLCPVNINSIANKIPEVTKVERPTSLKALCVSKCRLMRDNASWGLSYACSMRPSSSLWDWFRRLFTLCKQQTVSLYNFNYCITI